MDTLKLEIHVRELIQKQKKRASRTRVTVKGITRSVPKTFRLDDDIQNILSICDEIIAAKPPKKISKKDEMSQKYAKFIKAVCCSQKKDWINAIKMLKELGYSDYWIYKQKMYKELFSTVIRNNLEEYLINQNDKKVDVEKEINKYLSFYEKINKFVFEIMDCLLLNENLQVSHYASRKIAEKLLFDKSPFRMCSLTTTNDPSEGQMIYDFLGHQEWFNVISKKSKYQCFVACFTFDSDCLNQFRLYGKEDEKEATGVSISFNVSSFDHALSNQLKFKGKREFKKEYYRSPLFRCIYYDPKEKQIVSVGHSELSKKNNNTLGKIKTKIDDLKKVIDEFDMIDDMKESRREIIFKILLNLSYIVKHAAFKEEQECRVFSIQYLRGANHISFCKYSRKMYMDYDLPMNELTKITFAPKASEFLLFKDRLEQKEEYRNVECIQSTLPIA